MTRRITLMGLACLVAIAAVPSGAAAQGGRGAAQAPPPTVKVGEPMPDFALPYLEPAAPGERPQPRTARLSDFAGKQAVVLAFFPAAFSPG